MHHCVISVLFPSTINVRYDRAATSNEIGHGLFENFDTSEIRVQNDVATWRFVEPLQPWKTGDWRENLNPSKDDKACCEWCIWTRGLALHKWVCKWIVFSMFCHILKLVLLYEIEKGKCVIQCGMVLVWHWCESSVAYQMAGTNLDIAFLDQIKLFTPITYFHSQRPWLRDNMNLIWICCSRCHWKNTYPGLEPLWDLQWLGRKARCLTRA